MEVTIENHAQGTAVVHLSGRLDLYAASTVKQQILQTIEADHPHLVIDLGDVPFIDSSGLGALISGLKAARAAGGGLRIARPGAQVLLTLELTSLDQVLQPYTTVEEALADS